jgi:hypothetical protein
MSNKNLSKSIQALGTMRATEVIDGEETKEFVSKWMECALEKLEGFSGQDLSISIWGLAKMRVTGVITGEETKEFISKWMGCALEKLEGFSKENLSDSIWGLAKMRITGVITGEETKEFVRKWLDYAFRKLGEFNEERLSDLILALAEMGAAKEFVCKVADMGMVGEAFEKVRAYRRRLRSEGDGRYKKLEDVIRILSGHMQTSRKRRRSR